MLSEQTDNRTLVIIQAIHPYDRILCYNSRDFFNVLSFISINNWPRDENINIRLLQYLQKQKETKYKHKCVSGKT